ncbi:MAG: hypothetical protein LUF04_07620 [Bacteroides sp.]|nr:hypothetical protein [Bacteroides sp.]
MKKKYDLPEESKFSTDPDDDDNPYMVNESAAAPYGVETEMTFSPPLTEEELKKSISGDELIRRMHTFIDELFDKDENSI